MDTLAEETSTGSEDWTGFVTKFAANREFRNAFNVSLAERFRANDGVISEGLHAGIPMLLLHTVGAKSGKQRINPLLRLDFEGKWHIVGSFGGSSADPAWVHNLRANPGVVVEVGREIHQVTARELWGEERDRVWAYLVESFPGAAEYQKKAATRMIPLFSHEPA